MTADAANERPRRFMPISIRSFRMDTLLPADIYLNTAPGSYTLYRARSTPLSEAVLQRLRDHGVEELYLSEDDIEAFYDYLEAELVRRIEHAGSITPETVSFLYDNTQRLMKHLWENIAAPEAVRRVASAVDAMVIAIMKSENALWDMLNIAVHDYYTYTHCINVSALLIAACDRILTLDGDELRQVGLGGVLHDIGKKNIPGGILEKRGHLSDAEFQLVMRHPLWGVDIARQHRNLRPCTANIIAAHHERFEGGGYPAGAPAADMEEPVRMAKIVDVYDALTTHRPYGAAATSFQALKVMSDEMEGHFDPSLLREFMVFLASDQRSD